MLPAEFKDFFLASAGASAALVGLLFVAVSLAPERTVMESAPIERQIMATSSYTALINAFFVSLGALLPSGIGTSTLIVGLVGTLNSITLFRILFTRRRTMLNLLKRIVVVLESIIVYGLQTYYAYYFLQNPKDSSAIYSIAGTLLASYVIGLVRSWQLLGVKRYNLLAWLNPLNDLENEEKKLTPK